MQPQYIEQWETDWNDRHTEMADTPVGHYHLTIPHILTLNHNHHYQQSIQ